MDEKSPIPPTPAEQRRHEAALRYTAERQELFLMLHDMVVEEVSRQMALKEQKEGGLWQKLASAFS